MELVRRQITAEGSAALSLRTIIIVTTALYFATIILKKIEAESLLGERLSLLLQDSNVN